MFRILIVFIIFYNISYANDRVEVNALDINSSGDIIEANNGIEVIYQDSLMRADRVIYNRKTNKLKLIGNVEIIGYNSTKEQAKDIIIDINSSKIKFNKLFMATDNDIWIASKKAIKKDGVYTTGASVLSSCDVSNPIWKLAFDRSIYEQKESYIKLYGTTMYFMDVPVFYSPYLAFSTNKQRSSGLLAPLIGYDDEEGLIYEQPIFWAIASNMDMEFNPQIRTNRGYGGYTTFRFVDSAYSKGGVRVGYFKDKSSYSDSYPSNDDSHYGIEFRYDSSRVFSQYLQDYTDGLYVQAIYLNDIDYLNLQKTSFGDFGQSALQESKLNYYIQNNDYYMGINTKYFIDTRTDVNKDETLQLLPSIQLHKYLSEFLFQNLTYTIDIHLDNYYRKEKVNLQQVNMNIPIDYTFSLFDDYLGISLSEELFYRKYFFSNGSFEYDEFQYFSNLHKIKLFSDLTKKYASFTHVLQPSLEYITPGAESQKPVDYTEYSEDERELFDIGLPEEHYEFSLSQYFYDNQELVLSHRLYQIYYTHKTDLREYKLADLHNEIKYNMKNWQLYNDIAYSYHYNKIRKSTSYIDYHNELFDIHLSHSYRDVLGDENSVNLTSSNELGLAMRYKYNQEWDFNGAVTYNIDTRASKQWKVGFRYTQDCWNASFNMRQEIIPRPDGSSTQNSFYFLINFVPFISLGANL